MARSTDCSDASHFLPLLRLDLLREELRASKRTVNWLVGLLDWESPQMPVQQRTRSFVNPSRA